jgi:hypothetical protein
VIGLLVKNLDYFLGHAVLYFSKYNTLDTLCTPGLMLNIIFLGTLRLISKLHHANMPLGTFRRKIGMMDGRNGGFLYGTIYTFKCLTLLLYLSNNLIH